MAQPALRVVGEPRPLTPVAPEAAPSSRPLRIAMIGQRGVPATWGGIERHVEELGARLADRGHEVLVYTRAGYALDDRREHRGMKVVPAPAVHGKGMEALSHSATSTAAALMANVDVFHYHAMGPGVFSPFARRLSSAKIVQTIHGLDQHRQKWGRLARTVLGTGHWLSSRVPDATVVVSQDLAEHYRRVHHRATKVIPNGVPAPVVMVDDSRVRAMGLEPGRYVLWVGRLVPEKQPHLLMEAFRRLPGDVRLAVVGGSSATDGYVSELERHAAQDPRIALLGYRHGEDLAALYSHARAFAQPSALEGMPLTLLEAASYGLPIVASALPVHAEVLDGSGPGRRLVPVDDVDALARELADVVRDPEPHRFHARATAQRVLSTYSWDAVTDETEALYQSLTDGWRLTGSQRWDR